MTVTGTNRGMRERIRELATSADDYDRAVLLLLDDYEKLEKDRDNWQQMYLNMMTAAQRAGVLSE